MNGILTRNLEPSEVQPSFGTTIKIGGQAKIWTIAFLVDGKHVVSGGDERKIRRWRVEDGMEVGTPMDAGSTVFNIAVSRDGKWIVNGTVGWVQVWDAENGEKVNKFAAHSNWVRAVDVSPDSMKVASGSDDQTACVWSMSTGQRLLGPWEHHSWVFAVKFSPDGRFIATATEAHIRIYDSQDGNLVVEVPIGVAFSYNRSLAWSSDSKHIFTVYSSNITCLDAFTGATQWSIHCDESYDGLASDGGFIAASSDSSISFWDATTHERIGSVIQHTAKVWCMAILANHDIVIGGDKKITLGSLCNILPSSYCDTVSTFESRIRFVAQ